MAADPVPLVDPGPLYIADDSTAVFFSEVLFAV